MTEATSPKAMWDIAREHGDRYLLPRRFKAGIDPDRDRLYEHADWLVDHRYARRLRGDSNFAPGIELTGRPWSEDADKRLEDRT